MNHCRGSNQAVGGIIAAAMVFTSGLRYRHNDESHHTKVIVYPAPLPVGFRLMIGR